MAPTFEALVEPQPAVVILKPRQGLIDQLFALGKVALIQLRGIAGCAKISDRRV
jgi:hypothetical protein